MLLEFAPVHKTIKCKHLSQTLLRIFSALFLAPGEVGGFLSDLAAASDYRNYIIAQKWDGPVMAGIMTLQ
jgi:hypothetical protein